MYPTAGRQAAAQAAAERPRPVSDLLPRPWMFPVAAFAVVWGGIVAVWGLAYAVRAGPRPFAGNFTAWDGGWFLAIARHGYPHAATGADPSPVFFPLLPVLLRVAAALTWGHWTAAAVAVQLAGGAAAAHAVWALAGQGAGRVAADAAVVVWLLLPGSTVLAWGYSEPLAVACAAWCLHALGRRRWLLAGVAAAVAGTARLDMLALVPACAWAAAAAARRGVWRGWAAVVLAPLGAGGYVVWQGVRLHDGWFLWRLESAGWGMRFDAGASEWRRLLGEDPALVHDWWFLLLGDAGLVLLVAGTAALVARRAAGAWVVYTVVVAALTLGSTLPGIRYVLKAFPAAIGLTALPRAVLAVVVALLAAAAVASAWWWVYQPVGSPAAAGG